MQQTTAACRRCNLLQRSERHYQDCRLSLGRPCTLLKTWAQAQTSGKMKVPVTSSCQSLILLYFHTTDGCSLFLHKPRPERLQ